MIPTQDAFEVPILNALVSLGGQGTTKDVYQLVRKAFPEMTEEDLALTLPSGELRWINRLRWARLVLDKKGQISTPSRGVWSITDSGKSRLSGSSLTDFDSTPKKAETTPPTKMKSELKAPGESPTGLVEIYDAYESDFRRQLMLRLLDLTPTQFEVFAQKLLRAYGFVEVIVTGKSGDGGIDGHGQLRVGLATMRAAYQCKRWEGNVPRPEIDKFRGAIQGEFEQGIFLTTSNFTKDALHASIKKGAVPIVLLNGEMIVDMMIKTHLGVERRPLEIYYDRLDSLFDAED